MKAVAIINMPNCCHNCVFADWDQCLCKLANKEIYSQEYMDGGRQKWCPLRPLPERKEMPKNYANRDYTQGIVDGWNRCWDEVTGVIWD